MSPVLFYLQIQTGGERTQFDTMLQGESGPLINLCVGAPGKEALKRSAGVFKQGVEHALVSLGIGSNSRCCLTYVEGSVILSYGGQVWLPSPWMELADQLRLATCHYDFYSCNKYFTS